MKIRRTSLLLISIISVMILALQNAEACPVCFSAKPGAREAFLLSTAFLTFFPLGMVGALIYWFRKHLKKKGQLS